MYINSYVIAMMVCKDAAKIVKTEDRKVKSKEIFV